MLNCKFPYIDAINIPIHNIPIIEDKKAINLPIFVLGYSSPKATLRIVIFINQKLFIKFCKSFIPFFPSKYTFISKLNISKSLVKALNKHQKKINITLKCL